MSWSGIPELKGYHRRLGPRNFWLTMVGTLLYIGLGASLMIFAEWPATCEPKGRDIIDLYYCSPKLLSGGVTEIAAFAWLWAMPVFIVGLALWTRWKYGKWGWRMRKPAE
jgi:hypothetical protein